MNIYRMSQAELATAHRAALKLAAALRAEQPEVAALLCDAAQLARVELLVHVCKGDRAKAEQIHRELECAFGADHDA